MSEHGNVPPSDELNPEDVEDMLAGANDLLFVDDLLAAAKDDPLLPRGAIADLLGFLRQVAESQRRAALVLRRQPQSAERVAEWLDSGADVIIGLLPKQP